MWARRPTTAAAAAAAAVGAAASSAWRCRHAQAQELTPTQMELAKFLQHHEEGLAWRAWPRNGVHARCLIGAPVTGKSTVLKAALQGMAQRHPDIVPVYLDTYSGADTPNVLRPVVRALVDRGVAVESADPDKVLAALRASGKKLFLVVDHAEDMYRAPDTFHTAKSTGQLAALGEAGGAVCAVVLCGSSLALAHLRTVHGSAVDGIRERFPRVYGSRDLNSQRYSLQILPGGLPTDLEGAMAACGTRDPAVARRHLYAAGSALVAAPDPTVALASVTPRQAALYAAVIRRLQATNAAAVAAMQRDVAGAPWEAMMTGVSGAGSARDMDAVWTEVTGQRTFSDPDMWADVFALCDARLLVLHYDTVYPATAAALVPI